MDPTARTILRHIEALGWTVAVSDGGKWVVAEHAETGRRFAVRKDDDYQAACQLAELVGLSNLRSRQANPTRDMRR